MSSVVELKCKKKDPPPVVEMMAKKDFRSKRPALSKYKGRQMEKGEWDTDDLKETLIEVMPQVRQTFANIVSIPDLAAEIDATTEEAQRIHEENLAALAVMNDAQTMITTAQIEITPTKTGVYHLVKM